MSVEALSLVLHHSPSVGTDKLVLIGIANHMGDGGSWASVETLAKYANVDSRTVRRSLVRLAESGQITVTPNAGGTVDCPAHLRPNRYDVNVCCPDWCDGSMNHKRREEPRKGSRKSPEFARRHPLTPASPPDASVTPPPDASVTQTPDASVTQTKQKNQTQEPSMGGAVRNHTRARNENDPKPTPTPIPKPPPPAAATAAPRCERHTQHPNPPPCGACAALRHEKQATHPTTPTRTPKRPKCPLHPQHEAGARQCPDCATTNTPPPPGWRHAPPAKAQPTHPKPSATPAPNTSTNKQTHSPNSSPTYT